MTQKCWAQFVHMVTGGDDISAEELRACTTCNALCTRNRPINISPLDIILLKLRRYQIMEELDAPRLMECHAFQT